MMFNALKPLLEQCKALDLKLVPNESGLSVIVIPVVQDGQKDPALKQPISLQGSYDELDAEFVEAIARLAGARRSLVESVETAEAVMTAAKQEADKKAVKAVTGKGAAGAKKAGATAAPVPAGDGEDEDADTELSDRTEAAPAATVSPPAAAEQDTIFSI